MGIWNLKYWDVILWGLFFYWEVEFGDYLFVGLKVEFILLLLGYLEWLNSFF